MSARGEAALSVAEGHGNPGGWSMPSESHKGYSSAPEAWLGIAFYYPRRSGYVTPRPASFTSPCIFTNYADACSWTPGARGALRTASNTVNGHEGALLQESTGLNYRIMGCDMLTFRLYLRRVSTEVKVLHANKRTMLCYEEPRGTVLHFPFGSVQFNDFSPLSCMGCTAQASYK